MAIIAFVRVVAVASGVVLGIAMLSGCGGQQQETASAPVTSTVRAVVESVHVGRCGSVADSEVGAVAGFGAVRLVSGDALLCRWEGGGGASVTFRWFRGSPLEAYHSEDGTRAAVQVDGRAGFSWQGQQVCEEAVPSGDGDFVDWLIEAPGQPAAADCTAANRLIDMTLTR
ncbi:DUF3558 family protein [Nocardia sp. NPDC051030]|uniref:DUF3558 family protein n=1 Tax=Nocardia sp. NPDC051030 TaxID=3155162 RepID=UPI003448365F